MASVGEVLFKRPGETHPHQTKTVEILRFEVPSGMAALHLSFGYGPRTSTDPVKNGPLVEAAFELHTRRRRGALPAEELLRHRRALHVDERAKCLHNLMNVVLIDPSGRWRGRWDRNPSSDSGGLTLGRTFASKGFLPGDIPSGAWSLAIECHGVFGEKVSWEVEVRGSREEGPPPVAPRSAASTTATALGERPRREGAAYYFGEMHSHTLHSDGKWELEELTAHAAEIGADFLCLTDHNTTSGLLEAGPFAVTLIPGIELTTFAGHHPLYGVKDIVPWHEEGRVLPLSVTGKRARDAGALVGVAHPFVPGDPLCTGCRMVEGLDPRSFDLMEVWYRRWQSPGADNEAAYELWNSYWKRGHRITAVGARDWHGAEQTAPFPGDTPLTGIFAERNDPEAILAGLRRGRVIVTGGPLLDLELVGEDGTRAQIGDSLRSGGDATLVVRTENMAREAGPLTLRIFRSGEIAFEGALAGDAELRFDGLANEEGYYRAELWRGDLPRAITNHVVHHVVHQVVRHVV